MLYYCKILSLIFWVVVRHSCIPQVVFSVAIVADQAFHGLLNILLIDSVVISSHHKHFAHIDSDK
jgi:hypothetical protein